MKRTRFFLISIYITLLPQVLCAQSFKGDLNDAVSKLTTVVVLICGGAAVYNGVRFAQGDPGAPSKLLMCVIGAVTAVIGSQIVNFFVAVH